MGIQLLLAAPIALLLVTGLAGCSGPVTPIAASTPTPLTARPSSPGASAAVPASRACDPVSISPSPADAPTPGWPRGGPVPPELTGKWAFKDFCLVLVGYTYDFTAGSGNVVVNGSEIDFFNGAVCGKQLPDGVGRWEWAVHGNTLTVSQSGVDPCGRRLAGTYDKSP